MAKHDMKLDPNFRPEVKAVLDEMVMRIPGVQVGKSFGFPAYKINGKVFVFVGGNGVGVKLPEARVRELLVASGTMRPFEPAEGIVWREWVLIDLSDAEQYRNHAALLDESVNFVAGSGG
jgi:hypothetical protein